MLGPISLNPADIDTSDRLRPVDPDRVQALAASVSEIGLLEPIIVRLVNGRPKLVAGAHRLAMAKLLGLSEIAVTWRELTDDEARLVEIDENLIRADLTALDRAVALAERKRVYEVLHPETVHGGDRKRRPKTMQDQVANMATWSRYSKDAAAKTGLSERVIQRAVELVSRLSPEVLDDLRRSSIADNQAQLLALADMPADQQRTCAAAIAAGAAKNVAAARIATGLAVPREADPDEEIFARFCALWERSGGRLKQRIRDHIAADPATSKSKSKKGGDA